MLPAEQVQLLGRVPGWTWDAAAAVWLHQHAKVAALLGETRRMVTPRR